MTLSDFIRSNIDLIVNDWEVSSGAGMAQGSASAPAHLREEARELLLHIAAVMESGRALAGVGGNAGSSGPLAVGGAVTAMARQHAQRRLAEGVSLAQMVGEYKALRAGVVQRWIQALPDADRSTLAEFIHFDETFDQALGDSIAWYSDKLEESRDLLLGILGHDLRNPLGAARGSAHYLQASELDSAQTRAVNRILHSTGRMRQLVEDLLDFSRTRLGTELPISTGQTNMAEVCREVLDELEASHPGRELRLECSGDLWGRWDGARMAQMVSNLVANALQHGKPGTPVRVSAQGDGSTIAVTVHNEGVPLPSEARRKLFEPPAGPLIPEPERRAGSSGRGLGLYIVRQIVDMHHGSIEVTSSDEEGTTFTVRLPCQLQADAGPSPDVQSTS